MITDITNPQFNIANVPFEQRLDCLNQLNDARDNGLVTQDEMLNIACIQWFDQYQISKLVKV
jgi:hypothetical protein